MKTISVVAAIIIRRVEDGTKQLFATQRGYGDWKGWWEFPGGKIEEGESPEDALKREIREELATEINVGDFIGTIEYDYPNFHLSMRCYECSVISGKLELLEHENASWLTKENLRTVQWLPADITILDEVEKLIS
ncbi:MAG: (deoxy)nucleoside triphosphate pyrophosphohydrolase [Treponema sp.]|nr:(deoxy)nucleoside triphosphate pyrophosphohydrolase [Treponema sp.]